MQPFRIMPEGIRQIRKKSLLRTIPIMLIAIIAALAINFINSKPGQNPVNVLPMIIPVIAISLGIGMYRGSKRLKKLFESYTLTIGQNLITREQVNTPAVSLYYNEISEIVKNRNGSFTVKGRRPHDVIGIPTEIENYPEVEWLLQQIKPVTVKEATPFLERYPSLVSLATIALMVCVFTLNNKIAVALSGTLLTGLMINGILKVRNSKNIDSKTKKGLRWIFVVLASVIFVMIFKLTGGAVIHH